VLLGPLFLVLPFLGAIPVAYLLANALLSRSRERRRPHVAVDPRDVTIVVPVRGERVECFSESIASVAAQGSPWIVVGDGCEAPYRELTERAGGRFVGLSRHLGKKAAMAAGLERVTTRFVLFVDSDTVLPAGAAARLASYFSGRVGGVGASLSVRDTGTAVARSAEFVERAREVVLRAMSSRGSVLYLDGACAMYRTELVRGFVRSEAFQHARLLGRPSPLGDDWMLTDFVLRQGHETVRAYDVRVQTFPKENFTGFVRQNVRWSRSNWIRFGSYLRFGSPRAVGRFYQFEVVGTYLLPLIALISIATRLPIFAHAFSGASTGLSSFGWSVARAFLPLSHDLWLSVGRISLMVAGAFATGAFAGAVVRDASGPRLRLLAYGLLGSAVLFVTSILGLVTFWRIPAWKGAPLRTPSAPSIPAPALD
jgi:cellulose synthase/poly-beta-1,6-N-acetylglucosamine synthase-like glycosyltransferase